MKVALGFDHRGVRLRDAVCEAVASLGHEAIDLGVDTDAVRVVSMPCWELFEAQPVEYREEVLPPEVKARLSIEPGVELGWSRWVGDHGSSISIEHFGASAPGETVLEQFGYNLDNVVARASALLERV